MKNGIAHIAIALTLLSWASLGSAASQLVSRNSAGLGLTSNANLESDNQDSDVFYNLRTSNRLELDPWGFGLSLRFTDYLTQNANDVLGLRTFVSYKTHGDWTFKGSVLGQSFTHGATGFSEQSFNYLGFGMDAEKEIALREDTDLGIMPFYEFRGYSSLAGRADHTLGVEGTVTYEAGDAWTLDAHSKLARNFSNQDDFDFLSLEIGGGVEHSVSPQSILYGSLNYEVSDYMNRTLGEAAIVGNGKRQRIVGGGSETLTNLGLRIGYRHSFSPRLDFNGSWALTSAGSASGNQTYTVNEILALLTFTL